MSDSSTMLLSLLIVLGNSRLQSHISHVSSRYELYFEQKMCELIITILTFCNISMCEWKCVCKVYCKEVYDCFLLKLNCIVILGIVMSSWVSKMCTFYMQTQLNYFPSPAFLPHLLRVWECNIAVQLQDTGRIKNI